MIREDSNINSGGSAVFPVALESADQANAVLSHIRCIIRASDIHSKKLQRMTGLTTAQALVIRAISELGEVTTKAISAEVALSQATVTTVLDRLEANEFVERYRSKKDRRIVHARLTEKGAAILNEMPDLLDEKFIMRFAALSAGQRKKISSALEQTAQMMDADATDAASTVNGRA